MKVESLQPKPEHSVAFRHSQEKYVPEESGCYVLSSAVGTILYIGQAVNLRSRMGQHRDTPEKNLETPFGRPVLFHWLEAANIGALERAWFNEHIQNEAKLPVLNKIYSPVG